MIPKIDLPPVREFLRDEYKDDKINVVVMSLNDIKPVLLSRIDIGTYIAPAAVISNQELLNGVADIISLGVDERDVTDEDIVHQLIEDILQKKPRPSISYNDSSTSVEHLTNLCLMWLYNSLNKCISQNIQPYTDNIHYLTDLNIYMENNVCMLYCVIYDIERK